MKPPPELCERVVNQRMNDVRADDNDPATAASVELKDSTKKRAPEPPSQGNLF